MSLLDNIIFAAFICIVGGIATAAQGAVNAKLGQFTGQGLSSTVVFIVGAMTSCIYFLIEVKGRPAPDLMDNMKLAPWWAWTGGVLGAVFVIITILALPKLGAGTTTAIIVCTQLVFSCIIDNFEFFNIPFRQFSLWRGLATIGLIGCVGVIAKF
ncbi:hypothetical protein BG011_000856 [Mortierella polycephala]|uniref:DMT family transporter n=1 Tax=Mortierella polycephala TaxID=41804 RepID=A0A9P6QEG1_9FUNG|nr:hypothetical protein BG011_000856 [Mortierella polycephala]